MFFMTGATYNWNFGMLAYTTVFGIRDEGNSQNRFSASIGSGAGGVFVEGATGNVLIGTVTDSDNRLVVLSTTTPQARIAYSTTEYLTVAMSSAGVATYAITSGSTASHTFGAQAVTCGALTATGAITATSVVAALTTAAESWIGPSSTTGIYFKGGTVGIGLATPETKLDISSALQIRNDGTETSFYSASYPRLYNSSTGGTYPFTLNGNLIIQPRTGAARDIVFATYNGAAIDSRVTIQSTGNVGIGTTTPCAPLDIYNDSVTVSAGYATGIRRTMTHDGRSSGTPEANHFVADFIEMKTYSTRNMQWCANWVSTIASDAAAGYFGIGNEIDLQNDCNPATRAYGVTPHASNTNQGISVIVGNGAYDSFSAFNILSNYNPSTIASHGLAYGIWVGACVKTAGIYFDYTVNQGHALVPSYLMLAKSDATTQTFSVTGAGTLQATYYAGDIVNIASTPGAGNACGSVGISTKRWATVWADLVTGRTMTTGDLKFSNDWTLTETDKVGLDIPGIVLCDPTGAVALNLSTLEARLSALERRMM
jgi:hypothetical protein